MYKKFVDFIKYNNLVIVIIAVVFLLGTGVFAQTETGQALIGAKETAREGEDNTLLLAADLDKMNMDYQIEKVEEDKDYYYVIYTYIDLVKQNNVWIYLMQEKTRKVSKRSKVDLGEYLAKELSEENEERIKELKEARAKANETGEAKRVEVTEYSGLIGQTLDLAGKIFPGYEPVKKRILPSPSVPPNVLSAVKEETASGADDLTDIYNDYIKKKDPDLDNFLGVLDNCPNVYNPDQLDTDDDGIGDACETDLASSTEETIIATNTPETASSAQEVIDDSDASNTPDMVSGETDASNSTGTDASAAFGEGTDAGASADSGTDSGGADTTQTNGDDRIGATGTPEVNVEIIELPQ